MTRSMYLVVLLLLGLLIHTNQIMAQDLSVDWKQMQQKCNRAANMQVGVEVKTYHKAGSSSWELSEERKARLYKKGLNYLYKIDAVELLINAKSVFVVNHSQKNILYQPRTADSREMIKSFEPALDSLLKSYGQVSYLGMEEGVKHYVIKNPGTAPGTRTGFRQADIYLDTRVGYLKKIVYLSEGEKKGEEIKSEVTFTAFDITTVLDASQFEDRHYMIKGNPYRTSEKYKGYKLVASSYAE